MTRRGCWLWQAALVVLSCRSVANPPPRAPGIPLEAVWAGGADGGAWLLCTVESRRNRCTIYNDHTGQVWARGIFVLEGRQEGVPKAELRYSSFDGRAVHLQDGRTLVQLSGDDGAR
jgi:hypothetical protein